MENVHEQPLTLEILGRRRAKRRLGVEGHRDVSSVTLKMTCFFELAFLF